MRLIGIIALVAIIGFTMTGCGGDDDDKLPPAGNGSVTFPLTGSVYTWVEDEKLVKYFGDEINFDYFLYWVEDEDDYEDILIQLSDLGSGTWEVKVSSNGSLSLTLGTPNDDILDDISNISGLSVTSGLKIFKMPHFGDPGVSYLEWQRQDDYALVEFVYANKNGKVNGKFEAEYDNDEAVYLFNWDLKQGWNTVIFTEKRNEKTNTWTITSVTGKPDNSFRWMCHY